MLNENENLNNFTNEGTTNNTTGDEAQNSQSIYDSSSIDQTNLVDNVYDIESNSAQFGNNTNAQQAASSYENSYSYEKAPSQSKPVSKRKKIMSYVSLILVVSLISGAAGGYITSLMYKNNSYGLNNSPNAQKQSIAISLNSDSYFAAAVNEKAKDTVVGITTTTVQTYNSFFGGRQEQEVQSIGSGFIVNYDGFILTNSHVIGDGAAKSVSVLLNDGSNETGTVLWYDSTLDLAVVKINRTGLPAAELGDADALMVGEPVVAIGNPMSLDLNGTVTSGIISGLNRSITVQNTTIKPLIQTDASINPGNSGGPLFNAKGEVVGINTAKMTTAEGLGFSIPINVAIPILEQITDKGSVTSVYVGITGTSVENYEKSLGIDLSVDSGVIIIEVSKDSPVQIAGLKSGDIITKIDDNEVKDMNDLKRSLYNYKVGDKATITYVRDGEEKTVEITLKEKPANI